MALPQCGLTRCSSGKASTRTGKGAGEQRDGQCARVRQAAGLGPEVLLTRHGMCSRHIAGPRSPEDLKGVRRIHCRASENLKELSFL